MRDVLKVILVFVCLPGIAFGQYPDAVQVLIDDGLKIEARFNAPGGLEGYVGRRNGHPVSLYLMPDGEHVVIGKMVDGFGQNLSAEHIRAWLPELDLTGAWAKLENATWIGEGPGDAKRIVYVFTDPNCGYCIVFREKAKAFLKRGIQLRHIMVGIIQPTSLAKAASVIASQDPVAQLDYHDSQFPRDWLDTPENIPEPLRVKIENNNRLMEALAISATPAVLYRDEHGEVRKIVGLPDDLGLSQAVFRSPE
ncbi:hypothetical protein BKP64_06020 [Marinobacter salinus]|uniref:Thiol:disulfide interchange protein n=1 Tax=Marinobacter salinus TaxID=1874317 RepID=A0A1D9GJQ5_9GAMM|nr:thiol:disulfide interchange protein DsbG [Marinobacter salinus]AOY87764.1 hypothetical protein BKP64_06020 [Marinobacter salinus]